MSRQFAKLTFYYDRRARTEGNKYGVREENRGKKREAGAIGSGCFL